MTFREVIEEVKAAGDELCGAIRPESSWGIGRRSEAERHSLCYGHMALGDFVGTIYGIGRPCVVSVHYQSGSTWCHTHDSFDEENCPDRNACGGIVSGEDGPYREPWVEHHTYYHPRG